MNCRRRGIFSPRPAVCCLSEHSGMLEFAFLHTRRPVAENEVKSTNAGPNSAKWHQLQFCCCERVILQHKFLVLTQSFRLLFMVLPHGNSPWTGLPRRKVLNQAKWLGGHLPRRREGPGTASQAAFILLFQLSAT